MITADVEKRTAAWHRHLFERQRTTRATAYHWVEKNYGNPQWDDLPAPSHEALVQIISHLGKYPPICWGKERPRHQLGSEARAVLDYHDTLPIRAKSKQLAKARVVMVREMMILGALEQEQAKGLEISKREEREAMIGLSSDGRGGWKMLDLPENATFWKEKVIEWEGCGELGRCSWS